MKLVNDRQATEFGPRHVKCGYCEMEIILEGPGEYALEKWEEHKEECMEEKQVVEPPPPASASPSGDEQPASAPAASPSRSPSRKRPLEEPDLPEDDPDVRPANRPKKAENGPLEWLKWPLKPFMRGFRKSMGLPEDPEGAQP
jgi:hypothetical protein